MRQPLKGDSVSAYEQRQVVEHVRQQATNDWRRPEEPLRPDVWTPIVLTAHYERVAKELFKIEGVRNCFFRWSMTCRECDGTDHPKWLSWLDSSGSPLSHLYDPIVYHNLLQATAPVDISYDMRVVSKAGVKDYFTTLFPAMTGGITMEIDAAGILRIIVPDSSGSAEFMAYLVMELFPW